NHDLELLAGLAGEAALLEEVEHFLGLRTGERELVLERAGELRSQREARDQERRPRENHGPAPVIAEVCKALKRPPAWRSRTHPSFLRLRRSRTTMVEGPAARARQPWDATWSLRSAYVGQRAATSAGVVSVRRRAN